MTWIRYLIDHRDDIAEWITYVMLIAISFAHGLLWVAKGARAIAMRTAFTWDDAPTDALLGFATKVDRFVGRVADLHGRLFPRPLNSTPHLEAVEAEQTDPATPRAKRSQP